MAQRRRKRIGSSDRPCGVCGSSNVSLTESHAVRRGSALVNPFWKSHRRRYDWCGDCGAKHPLVDGVRDEGAVDR